MIEIGDKVYIKEQPENQCINLVGEKAIVTELRDDGLVYIETYKNDDTQATTGCGSVPASCLTKFLPIGRDCQIGDYVEVEKEIVRIIYSFPILHEGWELDYTGWVVECSDSLAKAVLTNHGRAYFATKEELINKANEYKAALIKIADAIATVDP